jgi:hypothetical protein
VKGAAVVSQRSDETAGPCLQRRKLGSRVEPSVSIVASGACAQFERGRTLKTPRNNRGKRANGLDLKLLVVKYVLVV